MTSNWKLMALSLFPRKLFEWLQKGVPTTPKLAIGTVKLRIFLIWISPNTFLLYVPAREPCG
mgnify:CR=1 FL=1